MTVRYTYDHEWVSVNGNIATIGITDYAQAQLGDVVFAVEDFADAETLRDLGIEDEPAPISENGM